MLLMTTTPTIEGRPVRTILGIVGGEAVIEMDWLGRHPEKGLHDSRELAMAQMSARAERLGASAVVGVAFDFEGLTPALRMIIATGTAVVL